MTDDIEVCGRSSEINEIRDFVNSRIDAKTSGTLYVTGPPGTGKTMSIQLVLDQVKHVPKIHINCLRAQSPKAILTKLCTSFGLAKFLKFSEPEMIARLTKKLSGRTCETHLIVLDEMDQLPKSRNVDLIRTIFSWPNLSHSKLILIGIANTVNLTSRYQAISGLVGSDIHNVTKIIFRPYSSKDIKSILNWYLENDENFEDAVIDSKALDLISMKFARENGDIRGALNALHSAIDDTMKKQQRAPEISQYPTPPSTPPMTPCKEQTNIASVANSIKKRQRITHYIDDAFPFAHQIILSCVSKLGSKSQSIDYNKCKDLVLRVIDKYNLQASDNDYRAMLDNLEMQGWISIKKGRPNKRIILKASDSELNNLVSRKEMIMDSLNSMVA